MTGSEKRSTPIQQVSKMDSGLQATLFTYISGLWVTTSTYVIVHFGVWLSGLDLRLRATTSMRVIAHFQVRVLDGLSRISNSTSAYVVAH